MTDFTDMLDEMNDHTLDISQLNNKARREILEQFKGDPRLSKVDLIWTGRYPSCCFVGRLGWMYGIKSEVPICHYAFPEKNNLHKLEFIDCDYENYKHQLHLDYVKEYHPKYATVRDIMTKEQCEEAGIKYYPLEQILDWAEELREHSENVIVIPKYDCLDKIPDYFMLGYSVPTSHGGTDLPIELFKDWRVHLLGGSPDEQIAHWARIPDSVISLDNNYIHYIAASGDVWLSTGRMSFTKLGSLIFGEDNEFKNIYSVMYICLTISLSSFASYFQKEYMGKIEDLLGGNE